MQIHILYKFLEQVDKASEVFLLGLFLPHLPERKVNY